MEKLTRQQRKFVEIKAETGNGTLAAKKAFGITNDNSAAVKAHEELRKPKIIDAIEEALPQEMLLEVHREGLFASKPNMIKTEEGFENAGDEPDYSVRHKYLDTAYKLKGSYAPERHVNLNLNDDTTGRTKELATRLIGLLRRGDSPSV